MKFLITILVSVLSVSAWAEKKQIRFDFKNEDLTKMIKEYAEASGQKFIVSPSVAGKATVLNPSPVSVDEAFNQLSSALARSGYAISKQGPDMVIDHARNIQRNLVEVGTELPPLQPERQFTWVVNLKYINADEVNRQIRTFTSRDGEMVPFTPRNQLLITDWVSNLYRIKATLAEIDKPAIKSPGKSTAK